MDNARTPITDDAILKVADIKFDCFDFDNPITLREWARGILLELVKKQDGFSGKRPFGNSGWVYYLGVPFVKVGLLDGDEDGYPADGDYAEMLILRAFDLLLRA